MPSTPRTRFLRLVGLVMLSLLMLSCISTGPGAAGARTPVGVSGDGAVTMASFDFPESVLLAEIYAQALEAQGITVKRALQLGPRELVEPALERGLVEFVPEYLGTALEFVDVGSSHPAQDVEETHGRLVAAFRTRGIEVLASAPAQDANALAITAQTAAQNQLRTISDLVPVASSLVLGGPPECPGRPLCLPGLRDIYGITFERFDPLDAGGPITVDALASGEIDVAVLFSTDGDILTRGFVVLEDDLGLQPAENITPVVRGGVVAEYGARLTNAVDAVSARLTTVGLQEMNQALSRGTTPAAVARRWLVSKGLIDG